MRECIDSSGICASRRLARFKKICRFRPFRTTRRACRKVRSSFPGRYTVRLDVDGRTLERPLEIAMDPRVSISRRALEEQYTLARRHRGADGPQLRPSAAAKTAGDTKAAAAFASANEQAASLLDTVDGADAPPTRQAVEAVRALESLESNVTLKFHLLKGAKMKILSLLLASFVHCNRRAVRVRRAATSSLTVALHATKRFG